MPCIKGEVKRGEVCYVPQQPWIINGTVEENVLFGLKKDEAWYQKAIEVSCLNPDLDLLPLRDKTEIGERGVNLSGGQRTRMSLARAM
jgi:ABC-type multidrug transport system fused ATPase/permease subunit